MNGHVCIDRRTAPIALMVRILEKITEGYCCIGAAEYGFDSCTCWEPIYDLEQTEYHLSDETPIATRTDMCTDCAFRPDSPERNNDDRYKHADPDELAALDHFWCHQGMRKPVAWRHPVGITIQSDTDAYDPPLRTLNHESVPLKADGTPGDRCAGFAAMQRHLERDGAHR